MCFLILLALEKKPGLLATAPHFLEYRPISNPSFPTLDSAQWFALTESDIGCSCNLYHLPMPNPEELTIEEELEKIEAKYRKKGWTEAKIQRVLSEKHSKASHEFKGLHPNLQMLPHVLPNMQAMFIHFFSDGREIENVKVAKTQQIKRQDWEKHVKEILPDVLYKLTATKESEAG